MKKIFATVAGMALWIGSAMAIQAADEVAAKPELWTSNFASAKAQAAKEGKDLLMDFTGSDWCGWCIKLKGEVFDTPEFKAAAPKDFVLVELDFPRDKSKVSKETAEQNRQLSESFGVRGYPSIFLADAQGRPYAQLGYQRGGPAKYLETLKEKQAIRKSRDAAWKKAEAASGLEKAKLLAEGFSAMDEMMMVGHYAAVCKDIVALDPQDSTGVGYKLRKFELMKSVASAAQQAEGAAAAEKMIDEFIAGNKLAGERKQQLLMAKLDIYPPRSVANLERVGKILDEVIAIDSTTEPAKMAATVKPRLASFKARLEEQAKKKAASPKQD